MKLLKNYKFLVLFFLFIILLQCNTAQETTTQTIGTFRTNDCVDLRQTCANCTFNNVTAVTYLRNSTRLLSEVEMNKNGTLYNYTFCLTSANGEYQVDGFGNPNGVDEIWNYNFFVNGAGFNLTEAQASVYIAVLILGLIILALTIWGAIVFPFRNIRDDQGYILKINDFKYLKILIWLFAYLEVLFLTHIMRNITGGFLLLEGAYSFFNVVFNFLLIGLIPFFPLLIFFTIIVWLTDRDVRRSFERGIPIK